MLCVCWRLCACARACVLPLPCTCPTVGSSAGPEGSIRWPLFKWAGGQEDKYFARITKGAIKVYQAPEMTLLDKKDLKLEGVQVRRGGGGWGGLLEEMLVRRGRCFAGGHKRRVALAALLCHINARVLEHRSAGGVPGVCASSVLAS